LTKIFSYFEHSNRYPPFSSDDIPARPVKIIQPFTPKPLGYHETLLPFRAHPAARLLSTKSVHFIVFSPTTIHE